jgi:hypothetical protein
MNVKISSNLLVGDIRFGKKGNSDHNLFVLIYPNSGIILHLNRSYIEDELELYELIKSKNSLFNMNFENSESTG